MLLIYCIPPPFHGDKYLKLSLLTFKKKCRFSFPVFADQCYPISNASVILFQLSLRTDSTLSSCHFTKDEIFRIINNLDLNKAHDHDKISIVC